MFDNIGGKIQGYAKVVFAIEAIGSLVGAAAIGFGIGGFGGFMLFLVCAVIFIVTAYLSVMFLYGFGELIENVASIRKNTEEIYNINYETYSHIYDRDTKASTPSNAAPVNKPASGSWRCSKCDTQNSANDRFCKSCGTVRS